MAKPPIVSSPELEEAREKWHAAREASDQTAYRYWTGRIRAIKDDLLAASQKPAKPQPGKSTNPKKKKKAVRTCAHCGKPAHKRLLWCAKCAVAKHDYQSCSACSELFELPKASARRRRCQNCIDSGRRARRGKGTSVRAVSGGLPGLGR